MSDDTRTGIGVVTAPEGVYDALRRDERSRGNEIVGDIKITRANYAHYDIRLRTRTVKIPHFYMNSLLATDEEVYAMLKALNFVAALHAELFVTEEEQSAAVQARRLLKEMIDIIESKEDPPP